MNNNKDYYEILGVDGDTPLEKIKEAYRGLAFQYHPDRNQGDPLAVERMKELNEAYAVLSDAEKRATYDQVRRTYGSSSAHDHFRQSYSEQDIFRGSDINKVFEEMAKAFGFRSFDEVFQAAYGQGYRTFEFTRPGVFGKFIIFGSPFSMGRRPEIPSQAGKGGLLGKAVGYLFKKALGLNEDRGGKDLYDYITLDRAKALSGGKVKYLDSKRGRELMVNVPPNLREGQKIRLKGMGSPGRNGGTPGDLYLSVDIKKPLLEKVRAFLKV
jgi:DnaJ-class molecular chaperone